MKLNRNNYEEYFLMYVDNELTAAERSAVEEFIALNPDLKPELEILQQTVLQPEPLSFDKSSLFAIASQGINKENHEEYFVEYVNNELSAADKNATETFVLQHPELQESFTAFKATVLHPEVIEFKNKEVLYRKEDTRVIAFSFQRFAVAAAVLGIIATGIWFYPSTKDQSPIAVTNPNAKQSSTVAPATSVTSSSTNTVVAEEKKTTVAPITVANKIINTPLDANNILATTPVTNKVDPRSTDITTENKTETNNYPQGVVTEKENRTNTIAGNISNEKGGLTKIVDEPSPSVESNVAYTTLETEETDNNIYVGALSINKDKLKGVFRKATRLFSSKTKNENEDGKLQIANLEIETRKNK